MTFSPLIIWAKATFFFEQLFSVVARTWLGYKSECLFFGPKFQFLAKKSDFCHTTPILVDDPFLALGMTVNFPHWERFFDFPFRSRLLHRQRRKLQGLTVSGRKCQTWLDQTPHEHKFEKVGKHKFCRNPDKHWSGPVWCYTTDENKRWEECKVPKC